jgi:hypothetical protein
MITLNKKWILMQEHNAPNFKPPLAENYKYIELCKNVYAGSSHCKKYLTLKTGESREGFEARKLEATLNQTFYKGVRSIIDIIFRKELTLSDDVSQKMKDYYEKADGTHSLNVVAKHLLRDMLLTNRAYVLVWTPPVKAKNALEEKKKGLRPYVQLIDRTRILKMNGKPPSIAVKGTYQENIGRYGSDTRVEHKIYFEDGIVERWVDDKKVETIKIGYQGIPIVEAIFDENEKDMPPFADEATYTISHFNMESRRKSYGHKLLDPTIVSWGMFQNQENIATETTDSEGNKVFKVEFGANRGINFPVNPETGAKLGDVEFKELSGKSDAIARASLEDDLTAIKKGFIEIVSEKSGNKTVTESENERVSGESQLSSIASTLENVLNRVHFLMCTMAGEPVVGEITVNKEFLNTTITDLQYQIWKDMNIDGLMTKETFLKMLQKNGALEGVNLDEELRKLEAGL